MYATHIHTAESVSRWTDLGGVELPADLKQALATFDAVRWVEVGHAVPFDLADVTAANAEEKVVEFAHRLIPALKAGARTPLEEAKSLMLAEAARAVVFKAGAAVPDVIEQLTPEFDEHAAAYVAAVDLLPETVDSDSLVQSGVGAMTAYASAQAEAAWLNRVSSWVAGTRDLPGFAGHDVEVGLRILRPSDALQLARLDAIQYTNVNLTLGALDKVLYTAARLGVEFGINTLREAAELRESLAISTAGVTFR